MFWLLLSIFCLEEALTQQTSAQGNLTVLKFKDDVKERSII